MSDRVIFSFVITEDEYDYHTKLDSSIHSEEDEQTIIKELTRLLAEYVEDMKQ